MAVRAAAKDVVGLVPASYMVALDFAVVAPASFAGVSTGDLPFQQGDELLIRPSMLPAEGWWLGRRVRDGRRGYVPRYVVDLNWRERARTAVEFIWAAYSAHTHDRRAIPAGEGDADLDWIAQRAAAAKLPAGRERRQGARGDVQYVEAATG